MNNKTLLLFAGLTLLSHTTCSADDVHWSYAGEEGPEKWGRLSPEFIMCSLGKNQSPIDVAEFIEVDLKPLEFAYQPGGNGGLE
jgi:carbonic anhydrase